ncbi:MAG TPA: DnaJ domain-containing protein [Pyrinomonadaceae bacterium]|nr:DnaJ domain-containing protein [Pyrinomonadaceae bacterium]
MSGEKGKDYYEILGAGADAPRDEIERRYKRLASERHPDRGGSEEEMKDLNEAYGVLRDAERRAAYDSSRRPSQPAPAHEEGEAYANSYARPYAPSSGPAAQADAVGGRVAGALLAIFAGLVLLFLVRFHYVVFLWPLALLACVLVLFGVWMAHAAMTFARAGFAPGHFARRSAWAQELAFWAGTAGGIFVVYLLLTEL